MTHQHALSLLPLLLSLPLLARAGGTQSPQDFINSCINAANFPTTQQNFAFLDAYDSRSDTVFLERGWEWNDLGTCDNSLSICTNSSDAADNAVSVRSFVLGFYSDDGRNEITIVTNFTCTSCPTCIVTVSFFDGNNVLESLNYTCSDAEPSLVVTQEVDFTRVLYTAILPNTTDVQCVTIDSYRIYQYRDCPETAFELADYDRTDPGIGPVSSTGCVANAESAGVARAGCENGDWSVALDSVACLCSAGFVPNENSTSCNACGEGEFKAGVGNSPCEMCPENSVVNATMTGCVCVDGYTGPSCDQCDVGYFRLVGDCMVCPSGSTRALGDSMLSCICTGNRVTVTQSTNTTSDSCDVCLPNNFMVEAGECVPCPAGSDFDSSDNICVCTGGRVTSTGAGSTSSVGTECDNCLSNMFLSGDGCVLCPESSGRTLTDPAGTCTCIENAVTPLGGTTTSDIDKACTDCIDGYSNATPTSICKKIVVEFLQEMYSVLENEIATLTVQASPPPPENDDITVTITTNGSRLSVSRPELVLTDSQPSATFDITGYSDSIALQDLRVFEITFNTPTRTGSAQLFVTDVDVVQAEFEEEEYQVDEDAGSVEVCVALTTETAKDVVVRIVGMSSRAGGVGSTDSAAELGQLSRDLNFTAPETRVCLEFQVVDDTVPEDDEQYRLTLEKVSPDDAQFTVAANEETQVFIIDNDTEDESATGLPIILVAGVCVGGAILAVILATLCILCLCVWRFNVKRQGFYHTNEDTQTAPTMLRYSASLRSISSQSVVAMEGKRASQKENEFFV